MILDLGLLLCITGVVSGMFARRSRRHFYTSAGLFGLGAAMVLLVCIAGQG